MKECSTKKSWILKKASNMVGIGLVFLQKKQGTTRVVPYAEAVIRLEADSAARANICTCTALGAHIRIYAVVFTFGNSAHRAFIDASTASDTIG